MPGQLRIPGHDRGGLFPGLPDQLLVGEQAEQLEAGAAASLRGAQDVSLPALLQVEARQAEPVHGGRDRVQPFAGRAARLGLGDEQAQALGRAPADPAAELVQLRDAKALGVHDDHDGRVRHVDAHLDDRRGHQDVQVPLGKGAHDALLLLRRHPAV